jgi:hypothetical protein
MKAYWTEKRPNGQPIEAGTFARVLDLEDGTNPVWTYGRTMDEVLEKIERTAALARATAMRRNDQPSPALPAQVAAPKRLTVDQRMQLTADLQNPAKAADAIAALHADATGVDPAQAERQNYGALALQWENEHPEFFQHPGNRQLLGAKAIRVAGRPARVTKELLTQCFNELLAEGVLFEAPSYERQPQSETPSQSFPEETPVQRAERTQPRRFSTGYVARGRTGGAPTRTLKYSEAQYFGMKLQERKALLEANDPDYLAAAAKYEAQEQRAS